MGFGVEPGDPNDFVDTREALKVCRQAFNSLWHELRIEFSLSFRTPLKRMLALFQVRHNCEVSS